MLIDDFAKKEEKSLNLFKDETKKALILESDGLNKQYLQIKDEFQTYKKEEKDKNIIQKKLDELKKNIGRIECSSFFESEIDMDVFNQIDGETQFHILNDIKSSKCNENAIKISNLLSFLSDEYRKSNKQNKNINFVFIPQKSRPENIKKIKNNLKIGISSNMTEILFENQSFNSKEFKNHINDFSEFFIEICYPSNNFDNIYQNVLNIKRIHENKLKIGIFITGIEKTDQQFYKNNVISYVRLDSCIKNISVGGENKGSFFGCSQLTHISIPNSVISIEYYSFCSCYSLTNVSIPFSVTSIGDYAFYGCNSLVQVSISSSVKSIGNNAFRKCSSLKQISIPNSVISIGEFAFKDCPSLKQISLPSSVTSIGFNTFD